MALTNSCTISTFITWYGLNTSKNGNQYLSIYGKVSSSQKDAEGKNLSFDIAMKFFNQDADDIYQIFETTFPAPRPNAKSRMGEIVIYNAKLDVNVFNGKTSIQFNFPESLIDKNGNTLWTAPQRDLTGTSKPINKDETDDENSLPF